MTDAPAGRDRLPPGQALIRDPASGPVVGEAAPRVSALPWGARWSGSTSPARALFGASFAAARVDARIRIAAEQIARLTDDSAAALAAGTD